MDSAGPLSLPQRAGAGVLNSARREDAYRDAYKTPVNVHPVTSKQEQILSYCDLFGTPERQDIAAVRQAWLAVRHLTTGHPGGNPGVPPGLLQRKDRMSEPDCESVERRLEQLEEEHRRALAEGDIEALERLQTELDGLMQQGRQ